MIKKIRYLIEALFVKIGLIFFSLLSSQNASDIAAQIAKFVGKKISVNKLALKNLGNALPFLTSAQKEEILDDMWDNLGRVVGEFCHIAKLSNQQICELVDLSEQSQKIIDELIKSGKGGILFSGHLGNWEVGPKIFMHKGLKVNTVYRPLNNPYVEKMTATLRKTPMIEKSANGNRQIIEAIKRGEFVIILADQKISEGEKIRFFNEDAITTTSIARLALKYEIPLIPARCIRLDKKFKFLVEIEKPILHEKTTDQNKDVIFLTRLINSRLEQWIKEYPAQWFWVHNRWKK